MTIDQYGMHLTKKEVSVISFTFVIISILTFIVGYFWGKQSVIDGFTQKTSQESFNDKVDYLLTMQSFVAKNGGQILESAEEEKEAIEPVQTETELIVEVKPIETIKKSEKIVSSSQKKTTMHFAALAGFGKKNQAQQMVDRLKQRNIDVLLKTRVSKSASGKASKTWYQVVTPKFDNLEDVHDLVDSILRSEKIKRSDINIF